MKSQNDFAEMVCMTALADLWERDIAELTNRPGCEALAKEWRELRVTVELLPEKHHRMGADTVSFHAGAI